MLSPPRPNDDVFFSKTQEIPSEESPSDSIRDRRVVRHSSARQLESHEGSSSVLAVTDFGSRSALSTSICMSASREGSHLNHSHLPNSSLSGWAASTGLCHPPVPSGSLDAHISSSSTMLEHSCSSRIPLNFRPPHTPCSSSVESTARDASQPLYVILSDGKEYEPHTFYSDVLHRSDESSFVRNQSSHNNENEDITACSSKGSVGTLDAENLSILSAAYADTEIEGVWTVQELEDYAGGKHSYSWMVMCARIREWLRLVHVPDLRPFSLHSSPSSHHKLSETNTRSRKMRGDSSESEEPGRFVDVYTLDRHLIGDSSSPVRSSFICSCSSDFLED